MGKCRDNYQQFVNAKYVVVTMRLSASPLPTAKEVLWVDNADSHG